VARGTKSVKTALGEYLATRQPGRLEEAEFEDLCRTFASSSRGYLRRILRDSGVPLAPLVEGVRQEDLEQLARTLTALEEEYIRAAGAGDLSRQRATRRAVIEAKDHARWSLRRANATPEHRRLKEEMIAWMLVWLENPPIFPEWVQLRKDRFFHSS
jgi:hypothetical protein